MKNILLLIGFALITLVFLGTFTVNQSENAVVVSKTQHTHYYTKPGLYFALPFYNTVNLIYMNNREAMASFVLTAESGNNYVKGDLQAPDKPIIVDLLLNWHVINSAVYFKNIQKLGVVDFNKNLVNNIFKLFLQKINGKDILSLNRLSAILNNNVNVDNLGVSIDNISIVGIKYAPVETKSTASGFNVAAAESPTTSPLNTNNILEMQNQMIESAFYQAQRIKTAAEINQATQYEQIKKENPKFYNYFRLIDVYKNSAKDKLDVPTFEKLYH